jgi:hypothetical protein
LFKPAGLEPLADEGALMGLEMRPENHSAGDGLLLHSVKILLHPIRPDYQRRSIHL